jgi:predicted TPR repeat methyltransferase
LAGPLMPEGRTAEIDGWIDAGIEAGLLVWGDGSRVRPRELNAEELTGLANKLRGNGYTESTFLCLKRVAELTPENSDAWHALGFAAQAVGRRDEARDAFANYLEARPEDASIRHILTALKDEAPPPRASDECILQIFNDFSSHYDAKMRDNLSYQAPERLQELIRAEIGDAKGLDILDIGCGTGLAGVGLKERAAEITEWLDQTEGQFDLIVACDCLVYFGDLQPVVVGAAKRLKPGGWFAFTTERGEKYPFHLSDSGRYTHHHDHVREVAAKAGMIFGRLEEGFLRMERGVEVTGLLVVLRKAGGV